MERKALLAILDSGPLFRILGAPEEFSFSFLAMAYWALPGLTCFGMVGLLDGYEWREVNSEGGCWGSGYVHFGTIR